jgi:MinD-like ATPase involved in chromosome partitioning or flagellar assembly
VKKVPPPSAVETGDERFAREQLSGLVQTIYLPGHRGGHRHIAFSSVERVGVRPWLSAQIGKILAQQVSESVCVVEVDGGAKMLRELVAPSSPDTAELATPFGSDLTVRVERNLWLCPASSFLREDDWTPQADVVRHRLSRLRREFGYLVIHAPALGVGEEAALMGQLSEGLVLVLEAHVTRRVAAVRARNILETMGVPLLGTILDQRTFPVPESIYRRI